MQHRGESSCRKGRLFGHPARHSGWPTLDGTLRPSRRRRAQKHGCFFPCPPFALDSKQATPGGRYRKIVGGRKGVEAGGIEEDARRRGQYPL